MSQSHWCASCKSARSHPAHMCVSCFGRLTSDASVYSSSGCPYCGALRSNISVSIGAFTLKQLACC